MVFEVRWVTVALPVHPKRCSKNNTQQAHYPEQVPARTFFVKSRTSSRRKTSSASRQRCKTSYVRRQSIKSDVNRAFSASVTLADLVSSLTPSVMPKTTDAKR